MGKCILSAGGLFAALAIFGCHHQQVCAPAAPAVAAPEAVSVIRSDGFPVQLPVPARGLILRDAVTRSNAAGLTEPVLLPHLFAVIERPEGSYWFSLPTVMDTPVGKIRLNAGELVRIVRFRDTDLARWLKIEDFAPPSNMQPSTLVEWGLLAFNRPLSVFHAAKLKTDLERCRGIAAEEAAVVEKVFRDRGITVPPPAKAISCVTDVQAWYAKVFIPTVYKLSGRRNYPSDQAELEKAYGDKLPRTLSFTLMLDQEEIKLKNVRERQADFDPSMPTPDPADQCPTKRRRTHPAVSGVVEYFTVKADGVVGVIRRKIDGKAHAFVMELTPTEDTEDGLALEKRKVWQSPLLFDGDQVDVTSPERLPIVMSSLLAPIVQQMLQPPAAADGSKSPAQAGKLLQKHFEQKPCFPLNAK